MWSLCAALQAENPLIFVSSSFFVAANLVEPSSLTVATFPPTEKDLDNARAILGEKKANMRGVAPCFVDVDNNCERAGCGGASRAAA